MRYDHESTTSQMYFPKLKSAHLAQYSTLHWPPLHLLRDFIIEKQLQHCIMEYTKCLSSIPFYNATQIINPFLNSRISANHDKVQGYSAIGEILIKGVVFPLYNFFCVLFTPPSPQSNFLEY